MVLSIRCDCVISGRGVRIRVIVRVAVDVDVVIGGGGVDRGVVICVDVTMVVCGVCVGSVVVVWLCCWWCCRW